MDCSDVFQGYIILTRAAGGRVSFTVCLVFQTALTHTLLPLRSNENDIDEVWHVAQNNFAHLLGQLT